MNLEDIDLNQINSIFSSLSPQDMEGLKEMAGSILGEGAKSPPKKEEKKNADFGGFDISSISKIAGLMSLLNSKPKDPRIDLLNALKPWLNDEKKQRVDQAVKMLQLVSILPKLKGGEI